ncbi:MAG: hypothetical protein J4G18_11135 [Anaerolineae bacterium]|nr:hypothetical protein [Anaerolineae bacterium]
MAAETPAAGFGELKSIDPKEYAAQPQLDPPAGYILVVRDIDSDRYRIDATDHPQRYIHEIMDGERRDFGLELLSILQTDDLKASETELYDRYMASLSDAWLELDPYQLETLRRSSLRLYSHASHYLRRTRDSLPTAPSLTQAAAQSQTAPASPAAMPGESRRRPTSLSMNRYGTSALRSRRREIARREAALNDERIRPRQAIGNAIDDLWQRHPWKIIALIVLLALWCLASIDFSIPYR